MAKSQDNEVKMEEPSALESEIVTKTEEAPPVLEKTPEAPAKAEAPVEHKEVWMWVPKNGQTVNCGGKMAVGPSGVPSTKATDEILGKFRGYLVEKVKKTV